MRSAIYQPLTIQTKPAHHSTTPEERMQTPEHLTQPLIPSSPTSPKFRVRKKFSEFCTALPKIQLEGDSDPHLHPLVHLVESTWFSCAIGAAILLNAVMIGVQTNCMAAASSAEVP